ncbi:LptF/LptG family permease [Sphingomonas parva]|uniref:LptF/LptG family permease n=1 Tax=Sphingomonas parva TaxID=2555898 RepID=A0A4Y8ZRE4_9SPHN|nr:LptF/LptG family permease [Sphingomonas parva]TFI58608.1 LptF/LptG family permease [Sphingomonas parva]
MAHAAGPAPEISARRPRFVPPCRIDLYLLRNLAGPFVVALLLTATVMMLERALRLAQDLAATGSDLSYFLPLLGLLTPYYLGLAMPMALMIALVFMIARLDEMLELEAMLAAGLTLPRIALPLIAFALLVAGATFVTNGFLEPLGRHHFRLMRAEAQASARIGALQPISFYRPTESLTLSFDAAGAQRGRVSGLFVHRQREDGGETLLTARHAQLATSSDRRLIRLGLEDGLSYQDADPARRQQAFVLVFDAYQIDQTAAGAVVGRRRSSDQKELTIAELLVERASGARRLPPAAVTAELYARLARSISIVLLPPLAIPLAFAAKRTRRGIGIALGGTLLMAFHHGVNFARNVSRDADPDPALLFGLLCGGYASFVVALFWASRRLPSHSPLSALLDRLRLAAPRPRVRRSRLLPLPGGTIGAYVAGSLAFWTLVAAAAVILLLQMVDLIERSDDFVDRRLGLANVGRYALLRLPILLQQAIGVSALAGAVFGLLRLTRFSEMVAIRAAGISLPRLLLMLLPLAATMAMANALLADRAVPPRQVDVATWWRGTDPAPRQAEGRWFRIGGDIVHIDGASPRGDEIVGLSLYRRGPDGLLSARIAASRAVARPGGWRLSDVRIVTVADARIGRRRDASAHWTTALVPTDLRALLASPSHISIAEARRALAGVAPVEQGPPRFETRLQRRFAEPLVPVIMLLMALPLALGSSRGPSWPRLLYPVLGGVVFLVCDGVLTLAAEAGLILPWIGAWAAPCLFGLIATTVLVYCEA